MNRFLDRLKVRAKTLKKEILTIFYAYQDKDLKWLPKVILFITIAYALSPIDLIPDFIPILGYFDDLIILPFLILLSIKLIPSDIIKRAREKVKEKPLILKQNWKFSFIVVIFWLIIIIPILIKIIKK